MKSTNVALLSLAGMLLTGISVYSLTPSGASIAFGGPAKAGEPVTKEAVEDDKEAAQQPSSTSLGRFTSGSTIMVEGRAGHAKLFRSRRGETFMMLEVTGAGSGSAKAAAPVNLALVIDRSGSMKGTRMQNAINAATVAVDRLNDGDVVSVVTFDTRTSVVAPPSVIGPGVRERVNADIRSIGLGGDTCISCGVEEALALLERTTGRVNRMMLLSDGDANHGVRDVPGFRSIGERARGRGASVTTIGVDVDYNEKILTALAQESNGRHYFVESDAGLARIFEDEAESLLRSIASDAEAEIDLGPGVELDRVLDRSFRRSGSRISVPLGTFEKGEVKTVLLKVRVPDRRDGLVKLADVRLRYRDLLADKAGECEGKLEVELTDDAAVASDLDPAVEERVNRSETASALKEANFLFEQGKVGEARRKLEDRASGLRVAAEKAKKGAPGGKQDAVDKNFQGQIAALDEASSGFATPPPAAGAAVPGDPFSQQQSRQGKGAVRKNATKALEMGF
jgi:Ca-activated chloride channel family protein